MIEMKTIVYVSHCNALVLLYLPHKQLPRSQVPLQRGQPLQHLPLSVPLLRWRLSPRRGVPCPIHMPSMKRRWCNRPWPYVLPTPSMRLDLYESPFRKMKICHLELNCKNSFKKSTMMSRLNVERCLNVKHAYPNCSRFVLELILV